MKPLGPERTHYWLAQRMAKTAGVDLAAAAESGALTQPDWAETVTRCRSCTWAEECSSWLDEHATVERAPDTCVNAGLFARLAALQDEA